MGTNVVFLHGHVGRDPEFKKTSGDKPFCRFPFATTETWKDNSGNKQSKTEWHQVVAWGPLAERISKNIKKGQELLINGKIEYQVVPDKDNPDKKITFTNIKMNNFDFCGKKDNNGRPEPEYTGPDSGGNNNDDVDEPGDLSTLSTSNSDDDIPF